MGIFTRQDVVGHLPWLPPQHQTPQPRHPLHCGGTSSGCFSWLLSGMTDSDHLMPYAQIHGQLFISIIYLAIVIISPAPLSTPVNITWWTNTSSLVSFLKHKRMHTSVSEILCKKKGKKLWNAGMNRSSKVLFRHKPLWWHQSLQGVLLTALTCLNFHLWPIFFFKE